MPRNLITQTIKKFRGMNLMTVSSNLGPEWAQECLNVIPSSSGGVEKLRLPTALSTAQANIYGPGNFANFQNALGVRQVVVCVGDWLYYYTLDDYTGTLIEQNPLNAAIMSFVQSNNLMFMANGLRTAKWDGTNLWNWGIDKPVTAPTVGTPVAGNLTLAIGRKYRASYGSSATGHIGLPSDISEDVGPITSKKVPVTIAPPDDPQVDQIWLYATQDGGDIYFLAPNPDNAEGWYQVLTGETLTIPTEHLDEPDPADLTKPYLNLSVVAPLHNNPAPLGRYLCRWQERIFIAKLDGYPQDVAYSGYERILSGRPEESFPTNNRLRLAIGADEIRGMGSLQSGVVIFSKSNEMYMLRGAVEDITHEAPVQYTAQLEMLPFNEGCLSHWSIVETPYGLMWLGSDKKIKLWTGSGPIQTLAGLIYPMLRDITPGQEENCRACYYSWLEKDWYLLAIPSNSNQLNRIIAVDLNPSMEENVGAFPFAIGPVEAMRIVENTNGTRQIVILQGGQFKHLNVASTTRVGLSETGAAK